MREILNQKYQKINNTIDGEIYNTITQLLPGAKPKLGQQIYQYACGWLSMSEMIPKGSVNTKTPSIA